MCSRMHSSEVMGVGYKLNQSDSRIDEEKDMIRLENRMMIF